MRSEPFVRQRALIAPAVLALVALVAVGCSGPGQESAVPPAGTEDGGMSSQVSGADWRVLGEAQDQGEAGRTELATTDEQLDRVWLEAGFTSPTPAVDWDAEIVIWFGAIWSSGQDIHLTDVVVDDDAVYPLTPTLEPSQGGPDDARAHAFVLAVDRAILPSIVPFNVQLGPEPWGQGWPMEVTVVEADLRVAGSTASDEQLHDDPDLVPEVPRTVQEGDSLPVGEEVIFRFTPGPCGWDQLGTFADRTWRLSEETVPPAELPPVEGDALLTRLNEDQIQFSIPETSLIYVPAEDGWSCEQTPD